MTRNLKSRFLEALAKGHTPRAAALLVGVDFSTAYAHRRADPTFAADWATADEQRRQVLEQQARRLALKGVERPIFYKDRKVGSFVQYDSEMLRFLLRAARPSVYRDSSDILDGIDLEQLTPSQRERVHILTTELLEMLRGTYVKGGTPAAVPAHRRREAVALLPPGQVKRHGDS